MSFRIDDILKRDANSLESEKARKNESISEPHAGNVSWCPSDRFYHNPDYYDVYKAKAISYPNIYARSPIWPTYPSFPLSFFPQLCHFSKRKGGQVRFTANQTDALEKRFTSHKYLSPEDRKLLADSLKLTDRQVKTWFQNRRAKWRRCNSVSMPEISSTKFEDDKKSEFVKSHN